MREEGAEYKYFAYCRKSSEDDSRQALSLDSQEQTINDLARSLKIKVVEVLRESKSAAKPGRPVFGQMLERIEKGEAQGIICWKIDRLSRNPVDEGTIKWLLQRGVLKIIKAVSGGDHHFRDNVLMASVEFGMANQYIRDLSENTKRGLRTKRALGRPPYRANTGYLNNLKTHSWEPDPIKAPLVVQAFEMYATGHFSVSELVQKMNDVGLTTRTNRPFVKSTMAFLLRSPVYYGYFKGEGELIKGSFTPLVTKDLWERVQGLLDGRITTNRRKAKLVFKYRGLTLCGECGCSITAERQKGHVYYRCTKARGKCSQPYVRERDLEPQLLEVLEGIKLDKNDIGDIHGELLSLYEKDREFRAATLKNLRTGLAALEDQKQKVGQKMFLTDLDAEGWAMAHELRKGIGTRISEMTAKITALSDNSYDWLEQSSNLLNLVSQAKDLFLVASGEQRQQLLDFVSSNRVLHGRKLTYAYNKPFALAKKIKMSQTQNAQVLPERLAWLRD